MDNLKLKRLTKDQLIERINYLERSAEKEKNTLNRLNTYFTPVVMDNIKTPLSAILGFSNLLANEELEEDIKQLYTRYLENSSRSLVETIDDLMDYTLLVTGRLYPQIDYFPVESVFDEIFNELKQQRRLIDLVSVGLFKKIHPDLSGVKLYGDRRRLRQVISRMAGYLLRKSDKGVLEFGCESGSDDDVRFYIKASGVKKLHSLLNENLKTTGSLSEDKYFTEYILVSSLVELMGGTTELIPYRTEGMMFVFTLKMRKLVPEEYYADE